MRLSIRVSITALILTVLTGAVTAVSVSSCQSGKSDARDLSQQVVEQTLRRIELRTRTLLDTATSQGDLGRATIESQDLIRADRPAANGFPALSTYFASTLNVYPELSYFGYALEATGEYCVAERKADGGIEVREYALDEQGKMGVSFYRVGAGKRELARTEPWDGYDPRVRPFYIPAKKAGTQVWTDTYAFWDTTETTNSNESREIPGVSCVTPAFATVNGERSLTGVVDTDFDLYVLCDFLRDLGEEVPGITFIVEQRSDGTERAIAHPDASQLVRMEKAGEKTSFRLVETVDKVKDRRVAAVMRVVNEDTSARAGAVRGIELRYEDETYLGGYLTLPKASAPPWIICMLLPRDDVMGTVDRNNLITGAIAVASLLAALGLGVLLSKRLADPVRNLALRSAAIGRLELEQPPLGSSPVKEVHLLMRATDKMTQSLRSFQKYVPTEIVREILDSGEQARLGGRMEELTVLFADVAGFTSIAESLPPVALVEQLGEYLEEMTQAIREEEGTVDKYIGDAVVAFWGAPRPNADHALAACRSALACQQRLRKLRLRWEQEGRPVIHARIGLSSGEMLVGNLGSPTRLDYSVLGERAQLAEHLEALNKLTGTEILISEATFRAVEDRVRARHVCETTLEGGRVEQAYELLGLIGEEA